jgi:hypothetical protein
MKWPPTLPAGDVPSALQADHSKVASPIDLIDGVGVQGVHMVRRAHGRLWADVARYRLHHRQVCPTVQGQPDACVAQAVRARASRLGRAAPSAQDVFQTLIAECIVDDARTRRRSTYNSSQYHSSAHVFLISAGLVLWSNASVVTPNRSAICTTSCGEGNLRPASRLLMYAWRAMPSCRANATCVR